MSNDILEAIRTLAALRRIDLRPDWADAAKHLDRQDGGALDSYCEAIGWAPSSQYLDDPRAHEFPLLVFHPDEGWGAVERIESGDRLRVVKGGHAGIWSAREGVRLFDLVIPLPAGKKEFSRAIDVFMSAVFRRKQAIVLAVVATFVVNTIALVTSLYSMQVYDRVVPRGAFSTLWVLSIGAVTALLFDLVLRIIRSELLEQEAMMIDTEVSEFFFSRSNDVRLDARPASVGTSAAQLRSLDQVRQLLSSGAIFVFADLPFALLFIFVIATLGGVIAIVLLIAFPLAIAGAFLLARLIHEDTNRAQISGFRKNGLLVEALDAAETMKANRGQWFLLSRWGALLEEVHASEMPVRRLQAIAGTTFGTLQQVSYICLVAWGAVEVHANNMTMGALIACSILSGRVNGPLIAQLPGLLVQWSYAQASLRMLDGVLKLPTERPADLDVLRPTRLAAAQRFNDVIFAYPGGRIAVDAPRLEFSAGERIGVIGSVGSGKSTLLKLMSGLYAPSQGQILMDRLDISQVAEDILRHHIGYLPQDYRLIHGSLRDNLLLGLSDPGDDRIMEVARNCGLGGLISSHPRGLDLEVSEGGKGLSGGQRALAGFTRLMLAGPKLLLLDEPTSNLDNDTEAQVLRMLEHNLAPDATLIFVTHKTQLLRMVKRLLVMVNGRIVLDGPTGEVIARLQQPKPRVANQGSTALAGVEA